jgi:ADP-dependent phosphofructokinase/glucokinase
LTDYEKLVAIEIERMRDELKSILLCSHSGQHPMILQSIAHHALRNSARRLPGADEDLRLHRLHVELAKIRDAETRREIVAIAEKARGWEGNEWKTTKH